MPPTLPKARLELSNTSWYLLGVVVGVALGISVKNLLDSLSTPVGAPRLPSRVTTYRIEPFPRDDDSATARSARLIKDREEKDVRSFLDEELKAQDAD